MMLRNSHYLIEKCTAHYLPRMHWGRATAPLPVSIDFRRAISPAPWVSEARMRWHPLLWLFIFCLFLFIPKKVKRTFRLGISEPDGRNFIGNRITGRKSQEGMEWANTKFSITKVSKTGVCMLLIGLDIHAFDFATIFRDFTALQCLRAILLCIYKTKRKTNPRRPTKNYRGGIQ